ncbi:hypothetical protein BG004_002788 [Podila humilis]|nr:hypothetical protein BG004_002788 [Podila humilis]
MDAATPIVPTNTLTITNLPTELFEAAPLALLRDQVSTFGTVHFYSPIKSFHRVFVVYTDVKDAQRAKQILHNTPFQGTNIRVYFGQHTELTIDPAKYYLHLPDAQKLLEQQQHDDLTQSLVSPPGSPPLGHSEALDDEEMEILELELVEEEEEQVEVEMSVPSIQEPAPSTSTSTTIPTLSQSSSASSQGRLEHRIKGLRIDTELSPLTVKGAKSPASSRRFPLSPISPSGSSSNLLLPTTPTMLAFSPSKESVGEQPFITIQDWGMDDTQQQTLSVSCH